MSTPLAMDAQPARQDAQNAADEIIADSRRYSRDDASIRNVLNEGRRAA